MRKFEQADSTVGMTYYNMLVISPKGGISRATIMSLACNMSHVEVGQAQATRALKKLVELGRIEYRSADDMYELKTSEKGLLVITRDLGDYWDSMDGGWEGWTVRDPRIRDGIGTRTLEAVLGLPPTGHQPRPLPPQPVAGGVDA